MRKINLSVILLLLIISCNKYENITSEERFNRQTGETEVLSNVGEWKSVKDIRIENEEERIRQIELKKQRTKLRDLSLKLMSWSMEDDKDVQYIKTDRWGDNRLNITLKNHSDLEIELITFFVSLYDIIEGDTTLVSTTRDSILLDVDDDRLGLPGLEQTYCCFDYPSVGENQDRTWYFRIYGFEGFD